MRFLPWNRRRHSARLFQFLDALFMDALDAAVIIFRDQEREAEKEYGDQIFRHRVHLQAGKC